MERKQRFSDQNWTPPEIKHMELTKYFWLVSHPESLELGKFTDIGAFTLILAHHGVKIEDHVEVGSHCSIITNNTIDQVFGPITLKEHCRIGAHSVIFPNVTIGANTIVGAQSMVKEDLPSNVLAYGVPAKIIRPLTEEEINR